MREISVLAVSRPGDVHGDRVIQELRARRIASARISLDTLRQIPVEWELGGNLIIYDGESQFVVTDQSTIWWRRPGWASTDDLVAEEAELVASEVHDLLIGVLLAIRPRWVDPLQATVLAENKLHQLISALGIGIRVPSTMVTNRPTSALRFASSESLVTKPTSYGWGLAPATMEVPKALIGAVSTAPVLVQARLPSIADLRVVTIAGQAFVWRRRRKADDPIDWRAVDPRGDGFDSLGSEHSVSSQAVRLADRLGISQSSQDWVETQDDIFFLEANPAGQWLFLRGAEKTVLPALIDHLAQN